VYVSLLRAVNVGGRNALAMPAVREVYESIGHRDVVTYLQSGNVVSTATARRGAAVAAAAGEALRERLGVDATVIVRTAAEMADVAAGWPFPNDPTGGRDAHVTFLGAAPLGSEAESAPFDAGPYAPDQAFVRGREVYLRLPNGYGRTKLDNRFFERRFGVAATTRNWRTVTELAALAAR